MTPALSVVMNVYNGEAFLPVCVESILGQTFSDFEFIIVNDGSTDATGEILTRYARRDPRILIILQENRGIVESANRGIGVARSNYIARMGADDVALPGRFLAQLEFMKRHPQVGVVGGATELINAQGKRIGTLRPPVEDATIRTLLLRSNPICEPAIMMRKDAVIASGGYRKAFLYSEEYDLWLRIAERWQFANLNEIVVRYRVHSAQVSVTKLTHQVLGILVARAAAFARREGKPDPLAGVEEITVDSLDALGISRNEFRNAVVGVYGTWIERFRSEPEMALGLVDHLLEWCTSERMGPRPRADAWLKAAGVHYQQGDLVAALGALGRALATRPALIGRPFGNGFKRLTAAVRN